ncbi:MAG TPA: polysaccharide biosynthesis/export family protein [Candidatus Wallbacteria bacterium]|nr:polysaccharide biosynthesis/export family protein [Candidatus Wallbacteria bacterium]
MKNKYYDRLKLNISTSVRNLAFIAAIFFIVISSAYTYKPASFDHSGEIPDGRFISMMAGAGKAEYTIGAGDLIKIMVYENPEYTDNYRVGPDGKISLPIIGTINVSGKSREGLKNLLQENLGKYIANPIVTIKIEEYNNNYVNILGEIEKPGKYDFKGEIDMMSVLANVGGILKNGNMRCELIRDNSIILSFDLSDYSSVLQCKPLAAFRFRNMDTLYFLSKSSAEKCVYVIGKVKNPGLFKLDASGDIKKLIDSSIETSGKYDNIVSIIRNEKGKNLKFDYNLSMPPAKNPQARAGDIIYISGQGEKASYCLKKLAPYVFVAVIGTEAVRRFREN